MGRIEKKELRIREKGAYQAWRNMHDRCRQKEGKKSRLYREKGITVCARWSSFEAFLEDMGSKPEGMTLERKDGALGYQPENCRWATTGEQNRNTTQTTITYGQAVEIALDRMGGMPHTEIAKKYKIHRGTSSNIMAGNCWRDALEEAKEIWRERTGRDFVFTVTRSSRDPARLNADRSAQTDAARDVLAERRRQIEAEGWTPEHDDMHNEGGMAKAAAAYALNAADNLYPDTDDESLNDAPSFWPWHDELAGRGEGPVRTEPAWWKPGTPRRNLVKAGALILAEIERLDRSAQGEKP